MSVTFRPYTNKPGFTPEFFRVHDFLVKLNQKKVITEGFLWGRWEWMFSLRYLDNSYLQRIGIWEDNGEIVALATYEQSIGDAWFCINPQYSYLKSEMLIYAMKNLSKDGQIRALIRDTDSEFQDIAAKKGFIPTQEHEFNAIIPVEESKLQYTLPEGYRIVSLADEFDMRKYGKVLWRGFNHEGEASETEEEFQIRKIEVSGPHVDLNQKVAVAAPNGDFVSYCGMWYLPGTDYALVEPVATDPANRKMGLGKAAVLEGVRRCGKLGAKVAYVGSSQQFYYNIGFRPCSTETWWVYKTK